MFDERKIDTPLFGKKKEAYALGIFFGVAYSLSAAMKVVSIRAIGDNIHTSVKNYYFGLWGLVVTVIANFYLDPGFFAFWNIGTKNYVMNMT